MLSDTEFFATVESEANYFGVDGPQIHKTLLQPYRDLAAEIAKLGMSLRPTDFNVCVAVPDPYVFADWTDMHTGAVLSAQFSANHYTLRIYADAECEDCLTERQFTTQMLRNMVFLFASMPSRYMQ